MKKRVSIEVEGMSCASCVATVKKAIETNPGVFDVDVNLATNKAQFYYDPEIISLSEIQEKVKKAGYSLKLSLEEENREFKEAKTRLILATIFIIPVLILMILSMFNVFMIPNMDYIELMLSIPLIYWVGFNIHKKALFSLLNKNINMDLLISIGTQASFLSSILKLLGFNISNFSFIGGMIIFFFILGKYLENLAKGRASKEIKSLLETQSKKARVIIDGEEVEIKINEIEVGDFVVIKPFEKIPVDGVIVEGETYIDESMLTGESNEVYKKVNDEVFSGTLNGSGRILVKVTKNIDETFLSNLIKLVEEAQNSKVPIQDFADKITSYFVPIVLIISALSFLFSFFMYDISKNILYTFSNFLPWVNPEMNRISLSIYSMIATLVIACPCALGLATPTAILVSSGVSAKKGIFIRNGEAIQKMKDITTIVFDKTGTLTLGNLEVTKVIEFTKNNEGFKILASLENYSSHKIAKGVVEKFKEEFVGEEFMKFKKEEEIVGLGIKGELDDKIYLAGNPKEILKLLKNVPDKIKNLIEELQKDNNTVIALTDYEKILTVVSLRDKLREDSREVIEELKKLNIEPILLTGDNYEYAKWVSKELNIEKFYAEVLPKDKMDIIKNLQKDGKVVAMVGDGINDAPSLKQADIGIAIGTGSDTAIEAGDIVLLKGKLLNVLNAIKISKITFTKIKQNLFWALFYNTIAIPLAFFGLIHPIIAEIAMAMSSINVITNSLRINKIKI